MWESSPTSTDGDAGEEKKTLFSCGEMGALFPAWLGEP